MEPKDEGKRPPPLDPYAAHELPALAARALSLGYFATSIGMTMLFALEWLARKDPSFAEDGLDAAAVRCLVPAGIGLVCTLVDRRWSIARFVPFVQGSVLVMVIACVLAISARVTGGMRSPYLLSLQTMLYLWGLVMPGGMRRAFVPIVSSPVIFFGLLAVMGAPPFADVRGMVAVCFSLCSATLSLIFAEVLERWRRDVSTASSVDALTRLLNRRYLLERFSDLHGQSQAAPLSVLVFDIDHFKRINDTYGHAAGDEVIRGVAQILSESTRATDLSGRLGGEEFVLVLDACDSDAAMTVAERIRASVESLRFRFGRSEIRATVSIGIATQAPGELRTTTTLLQEADDALYESKGRGRNCVSIALVA